MLTTPVKRLVATQGREGCRSTDLTRSHLETSFFLISSLNACFSKKKLNCPRSMFQKDTILVNDLEQLYLYFLSDNVLNQTKPTPTSPFQFEILSKHFCFFLILCWEPSTSNWTNSKASSSIYARVSNASWAMLIILDLSLHFKFPKKSTSLHSPYFVNLNSWFGFPASTQTIRVETQS